MNLIRSTWTQQDGKEFLTFLQTLSRGKEKADWEQKIINTKMTCLAIPAPEIGKIVKELAKGNFLSFLDLHLQDNFNVVSVNGTLICKIADFTLMCKYLQEYVSQLDNWAHCDLLKFTITNENKDAYFNLAQSFIQSKKPFVRRTGLKILFEFITDDQYIQTIFDILNTFYDEDEYYVNMINAWLISVCFVKQREKTLAFLQNHHLNKFTLHKAISKCRDSLRVSKEDKEMLLQFK